MSHDIYASNIDIKDNNNISKLLYKETLYNNNYKSNNNIDIKTLYTNNIKRNYYSNEVIGRSAPTTHFVINFKRLRFFPLARPSSTGETIFTTSLGCVSKFLNKGKSTIKSKSTFLLVSKLLRRILLYTNFLDMHLIVNRIPLYFQEILNSIHSPSKSLYTHPFVSRSIVDESEDDVRFFDFKYISFTNVKSYGYIK
jgi:hypothetical protein